VTKREAPAEQGNNTLSDNISLFQSIRVLQDEDDSTVRDAAAQSNSIDSRVRLGGINDFRPFYSQRPDRDVRQDFNPLSNDCGVLHAALHPHRLAFRDLHEVETPQDRKSFLRLGLRWTQGANRLIKRLRR
jgi:hypothetical protein